ncbi:MAG TPA: precorrin-8X methylmutase [Candidatus Hungatella pullicola]|nr:precorrin-8X methylmutase [Candidatus Hungatella pullicola]
MTDYKGFEKVLPNEIEKRSFEIITEELKGRELPPENEQVIKRVIHTTADFDYADSLYFSPGAVESAIEAVRRGTRIITDTNMGRSGINQTALKKLGCRADCFMADEDVAKAAMEQERTRAWVSMDKAADLKEDCIFAVGNAPTALVRLYQLVKEEKIRPKLIIAVPVGFVNVIPAKELILELAEVPTIVARGRKGGSNVAAAIVNAILYQAGGR